MQLHRWTQKIPCGKRLEGGFVMKKTVYIPSHNRPETITTHLLFSDYRIIVHNEEQRANYAKNKTINPDNIIVSNTPPGASINRQYALHNVIPFGEWYVMADDNITSINCVHDSHYANERNDVSDKSFEWRKIYNTNCSEEKFFAVAEDTTAKAEQMGYHHCGFALTDNFFFNGVKFKHASYVIGKLMVSRNLRTRTANEIFGYEQGNVLEDMTATAENFLRWGGVVLNSYLKPVAKHYMPGGIGTYEERLPRKKVSSRNLFTYYKGLFDFKEEDQSDVKIILRQKDIQTWRKQMKENMGSAYPYEIDAENRAWTPLPIKKDNEQQSLF